MWLSIRLMHSEFEASCFAGGCASPRLRLVIADVDRKKTASWPIQAQQVGGDFLVLVYGVVSMYTVFSGK